MKSLDAIVKEMLSTMSDSEKRSMIDSLRSVIHEELFDLSATPAEYPCCPHCGSVSIVRKGVSNGNQRYLCKDCGRTFSNATNHPLLLSKLNGSVWMQYAECFVYQLSLRECAAVCHVCLKSSFNM